MRAFRIIVSGVVQGVGFRPFVHRIALLHNLSGYVRNSGGAEVEIVVEGDPRSISEFLRDLILLRPPPAHIDELIIEERGIQGFKSFRIEASSQSAGLRSIIPPDIAICDECLREVLTPSDRRYRYAFNSCAWCGPRFSMMYTVPYDRENTSMRKYKLCDECAREYNDIENIRRYHAEGISCPKDGPKLVLKSIDGAVLDVDDPIKEAAKLIDSGFIVAVKGIGGFHIAAKATDDKVVAELRKRKNRPTKPFAVMVLNLDVARSVVELNEEAERLLLSPQRPILLLPKKSGSPISPLTSPGMKYEGIFLPYTALHYLLLSELKDRLAIMTSANIHGEPMCIDDECVYTKLRRVVDYVLTHDREIVHRVDDSVVRFTDGEPVILRRGRGYAPLWIRLNFSLPSEVIAFGAELQTAGAVAFEDKIVLTQYIGDLDSYEALRDLDRELQFFIDVYRITPRAVLAIDKHPHYRSRTLALEFAQKYGSKIVEVQHHHAHIVSTAIDRGASTDSKFGGIAIDGVGYGDDGRIWGGEVMVVDSLRNYKRVAHLPYVPITGDRDVEYPLRMALNILYRIYGAEKALEILEKFVRLDKSVEMELHLQLAKLRSRLYTWTSSTGRILDAVSALLNICLYRSYEGEPAILLEQKAEECVDRDLDELHPKVVVSDVTGLPTVDLRSLIDLIVSERDPRNSSCVAYRALAFIGLSLGELLVYALKGLRTESTVYIGGGAAVNSIIVRHLRRFLRNYDFEVVLPRSVPPNDGGIAVGQAVIASLIAEEML